MALFTLSAPKAALSALTIKVFASSSCTAPDACTTPLSLLSASRVGVGADAGPLGSVVATVGGVAGVADCSVAGGEAGAAGGGDAEGC
jgi:hypothetical protein